MSTEVPSYIQSFCQFMVAKGFTADLDYGEGYYESIPVGDIGKLARGIAAADFVRIAWTQYNNTNPEYMVILPYEGDPDFICDYTIGGPLEQFTELWLSGRNAFEGLA